MSAKLWKNFCEVCGKRGVFNFPEEPHGIRCKSDMEPGMVDRVNPQCAEENCTTRPSYNYPGQKKGLYCFKHKEPTMKNVMSDYCVEPGCDKRASFNLPGQKKVIYCAQHRPDGFVDVAHRKCQANGCGLIPCFNYPGEKKGIYCRNHSLEGMQNIVDKLCQEKGCKKRPTFNYSDKRTGAYCRLHMKLGMIDVINKSCIHKNCTTQASYNLFGHQALYCKSHAPENSILHPTPRCKALQCTTLATYGTTKRPQHCEYHSTKDEHDMVSVPCSSCGLDSIIDEQGLCYYCNPTNALKYLHAKELKVKEYLDTHDIIYDQHDKVIDGGKLGKERPDFLFDRKTHYLVLEVDENQHGSHACECEQARMVNISQSLGKPTVFIRYNPDNYVKPGKVKKTANEDHDTRMAITVEILKMYFDTIPDVFLSVTQLFFDGWDGEHQLETILEYESPKPKPKPKLIIKRKQAVMETTQIPEDVADITDDIGSISLEETKIEKPIKSKPKIIVKRKPTNPIATTPPIPSVSSGSKEPSHLNDTQVKQDDETDLTSVIPDPDELLYLQLKLAGIAIDQKDVKNIYNIPLTDCFYKIM